MAVLTGPLADSERVAAREFCGYSVYGSGPGDATFARFMISYRTLEYRLTAMTPEEIAITRDHLAACQAAKLGWRAGADNLDTDQAAIWYRNRDEMPDRRLYYRECRMDLVRFLGLPPGPELAGSNSIQLIV